MHKRLADGAGEGKAGCLGKTRAAGYESFVHHLCILNRSDTVVPRLRI